MAQCISKASQTLRLRKPFEARSWQDPALTPNRSEPAYFEHLDGTMSAPRLWAKSIRTSCARLSWLPEEILAKSLRRLRTIPFRAKRVRGYDRASRKRETFRERHSRAMEGFAKWDLWGEPGVEDEEDDGW